MNRSCNLSRHHSKHDWWDYGRRYHCEGDYPEPDRDDPDPEFHQSNHYDIHTPNRPTMRRGR